MSPDFGGSLLLDQLMPEYDVVERHRIMVRASPAVVFDAIREANLAGGPVTRLLLALRAAPAAAVSLARSPRATCAQYRDRTVSRHSGLRLRHFEQAGFTLVAERAPQEIVIGLLGRFWTPRGALAAEVNAGTFKAGPPMGQALAGWNFTITERPDGWSELRTETRVLCAADARWKFRLYWLAVRPGSGLIRRSMLHAIRRHAELRRRDLGRGERRQRV
ncbi:MAG: hypothetical protein KY432_06465 [Acidobacteria bacterium]|nr:hypothetical protein [Acidobacteriota bacterium]